MYVLYYIMLNSQKLKKLFIIKLLFIKFINQINYIEVSQTIVHQQFSFINNLVK